MSAVRESGLLSGGDFPDAPPQPRRPSLGLGQAVAVGSLSDLGAAVGSGLGYIYERSPAVPGLGAAGRQLSRLWLGDGSAAAEAAAEEAAAAAAAAEAAAEAAAAAEEEEEEEAGAAAQGAGWCGAH